MKQGLGSFEIKQVFLYSLNFTRVFIRNMLVVVHFLKGRASLNYLVFKGVRKPVRAGLKNARMCCVYQAQGSPFHPEWAFVSDKRRSLDHDRKRTISHSPDAGVSQKLVVSDVKRA